MTQDSTQETTPAAHRRRGWWLGGALVAMLAVAIALWWRSAPSARPTTQGPQEREAAETGGGSPDVIELEPGIERVAGLAHEIVRLRSVADTIQATGVVGPDETRVGRIRPLAEGRVTRVAARVGDRVAPGQTLLLYDSITAGELASAYRAAIAALERANAEADVARRSLERADNLVEMGAIARGERDRRFAEHQRALADVNSARAVRTNLEEKLRRLGVSEEQLHRMVDGRDQGVASWAAVSAPFRGVVIEVQAAPGEVITPDRELFTIADLSRVWIQGDLYQKDIAKVRVGGSALVTVDAYPGETFTGRITHVSNVLDADTRTAKVRCEVPNADGRLKVQMFATLDLPVSASRDALVVPARAVQDVDGVPTVFVRLDETRFEKRPVGLGAAAGDLVEVTAGLTLGESVVTEGALMLKSRLKLRVEAEEDER